MGEIAAVQAFLQEHALVAAAINGAVVAARTDIAAFASWKRFDDAMAYDWGVALWRWFQGAVLGALIALGMGA